MLYNCEICNKEKYIRPSHYARVERHFCSRECRGVADQGEGNPMWKDNHKACKNCCEEFKPAKANAKFCSQKCMGEFDHKKNSIKLHCLVCGTLFTTIKAKKNTAVTCGMDCKNELHSSRMLGGGNSNWLGGKSFEPYCPSFNKKLKVTVKSRDGNCCQLCGIHNDENFSGNGYSLSIHHIDYDKFNNSLSNLISLCNSCHGKTNYNRNIWKEELSALLKR